VRYVRKSAKWVSLIATGLFLFNLLALPVQAATPEALEDYRETVQEVMTVDGQVGPDDRAFLNEKKGELGLTDEEATRIEEEVRLAHKGAPSSQRGQDRY
jgi:hypothetical protein